MAIRVGHRKHNSMLVVALTLACFISLSWLGFLGWGVSNRVAWAQYEPLWMLQRDCVGNSRLTRSVAVAEVLRRLNNKMTAARDIRPLVDEFLSIQSGKRLWDAGWGDVIEVAHDLGLTSAEQWKQYLEHGADLDIEARSRVRAGDPIPVRLVVRSWRFGTRQRISVLATGRVQIADVNMREQRCTVVSESYKVGGKFSDMQRRESPEAGNSIVRFIFRGRTEDREGWDIELTDEAWQRIPQPGPLRVKVMVDAKTTDFTAGVQPSAASWQTAVAGGPFIYTSDVDCIPMTEDPDLLTQMQAAIHVNRVSISGAARARVVRLSLSAGSTPAPASFNVWLRINGNEMCTGRFATLGRDGTVVEQILEVPLSQSFIAGDGTADVILKSNRLAAAHTLNQYTGWDGELKFPSIKVVQPGASAQKPTTDQSSPSLRF